MKAGWFFLKFAKTAVGILFLAFTLLPVRHAEAVPVELRVSTDWTDPVLPLFGVSGEENVSFSVFFDTRDTSHIIPAGSDIGTGVPYRYPLYLFDSSAVRFSTVQYGTQDWENNGLFPIGWPSDGQLFEAYLTLEGGLTPDTFRVAVIRLSEFQSIIPTTVTNIININTNGRIVDGAFQIGRAGSINTTSRPSGTAFLKAQSMELLLLSEPATTLSLFVFGLASLGLVARKGRLARAF